MAASKHCCVFSLTVGIEQSRHKCEPDYFNVGCKVVASSQKFFEGGRKGHEVQKLYLKLELSRAHTPHAITLR